jgi:hypothetical protein
MSSSQLVCYGSFGPHAGGSNLIQMIVGRSALAQPTLRLAMDSRLAHGETSFLQLRTAVPFHFPTVDHGEIYG